MVISRLVLEIGSLGFFPRFSVNKSLPFIAYSHYSVDFLKICGITYKLN